MISSVIFLIILVISKRLFLSELAIPINDSISKYESYYNIKFIPIIDKKGVFYIII